MISVDDLKKFAEEQIEVNGDRSNAEWLVEMGIASDVMMVIQVVAEKNFCEKFLKTGDPILAACHTAMNAFKLGYGFGVSRT